MNPASSTIATLNDSKVNGSANSFPYDINQVIHMTREEWRAQRLHDIANAFESAFDALEVKA